MRLVPQELRYALRTLARRPGFAATAVLTLALGIGANTAIFSVFKAVLLAPLPYPDADQLVLLLERNPRGELPVAYPVFQDWGRQAAAFEHMAAFRPDEFVVTGPAPAERVNGKRVSHQFFATLGVKAVLGREFLPQEDRPGASPAVVLGYRFWQRRFGADPAILGQHVTIDEESHAVVGILPADFRIYGPADLYLPLAPVAHTEGRNNHNATSVVARLKPGVAFEQARSQMTAIARRLEQQYPEAHAGETVSMKPLAEALAGWLRPTLQAVFGAVGLLLLIACVNVTNLLLARSTEREREFALRAALGASRWGVARQVLLESTVLALAGGLLGTLLAAVTLKSLVAIAPGDLTARGVHIDCWVLAFTTAVCCLTALLFGLAPALRVSRTDLHAALKEGGRASTEGARRRRFRDLLVAAEIALAVVLLIGAGLLLRSVRRLLAVDPGFKTDHVLSMRLLASPAKFLKPALAGGRLDLGLLTRLVAVYQRELIQRVQATPGVQAAATAFPIPLTGETCQMPVLPEGQPDPTDGQYSWAHYYVISPDYFQVMSIPLRKGRAFTLADDWKSLRVAVVNETMARNLWPGQDPVGKRFRFPNVPEMQDWLTVAAVVGDTKPRPHLPAPPQFYMSFQQWPQAMAVVARTGVEPMYAAPAIQRVLAQYDKEMPVYDVRTMDQRLSDSRSYREAVTLLLSIFAALALVLTAVGVYGVTAYSVSQRTHEIGVRMALGAEASGVLRMVVGRAALVALAGVAAGLAGSLAATRLLTNLLFGVGPTDPLTFAAIAALLGAVAAAAGYIPAQRAAAVDPVIALRCE